MPVARIPHIAPMVTRTNPLRHGSPSEPPRDRMTRVGDRLRTERERRGILLEQVSESTKIRKQYLEAVERQDWDALPGPVFTRGYVHTYAQYLGMDPKYMMNAYERELRILRAKDPSASAPTEGDLTKAILERLARTEGLELARSWSRNTWIGLCLVGACAGAVAVWIVFKPLGTGSDERTATETRVPTKLKSTVAPPGPDAVLGGNASRVIHPSGRGVPQAPAADVSDDRKALSGPGNAQLREQPQAAAREVSATAPASRGVDLPGTESLSGDGRLKVSECGAGTDVVDLQLVGRADRFAEGTVVWFWTRVIDGRRGDTIRHVWLHDGQVIGVAKLKIGGPQWRTRSRRRLTAGSLGAWTVEARDPEERMLASVGFTCVPGE